MNEEARLAEMEAKFNFMSDTVGRIETSVNALSEKIDRMQGEIYALKTQLELNDQKTNKLDAWTVRILGGVITVLIGFIAVKLGLKS